MEKLQKTISNIQIHDDQLVEFIQSSLIRKSLKVAKNRYEINEKTRKLNSELCYVIEDTFMEKINSGDFSFRKNILHKNDNIKHKSDIYAVDDTHCTDTYTCQNKENADACSDSTEACMNVSCANQQTTCINTSCTDDECTNSGNAGSAIFCQDSMCINTGCVNGINNLPSGESACIDNTGCRDRSDCINDKCTDSDCIDEACHNNECCNELDCQDNQCFNETSCTNNSNCAIDGCTNVDSC